MEPESIFLATFTEEAARNWEDRIAQNRAAIVAAGPELANMGISKLRIGTLHGLCNDLLQEFRAPNYQNVRLMDEFEQSMFVYDQSSIVKTPNVVTDLALWSDFEYLFSPRERKSIYGNAPAGDLVSEALARELAQRPLSQRRTGANKLFSRMHPRGSASARARRTSAMSSM